MTLADYIAKTGLKDAELAERCGCDRTTILRIRTGRTKPSTALMERIAVVTGGLVQPNDYFDRLPEADAA